MCVCMCVHEYTLLHTLSSSISFQMVPSTFTYNKHSSVTVGANIVYCVDWYSVNVLLESFIVSMLNSRIAVLLGNSLHKTANISYNSVDNSTGHCVISTC